MDVAIEQAWTQQEFFGWAEAREERYEFDGVRPVAMTGGNANHSAIPVNIVSSLDRRLGNGPCRVLGPDAGVATVGDAVRYPDALVTYSPFDGAARTVPGAVIVFEVLSPASERVDRLLKVREYAAVPSIRRYVIVESAYAGLTVLARDAAGGGWLHTSLAEADMLHMPEASIEVPVAELYRGITFPAER